MSPSLSLSAVTPPPPRFAAPLLLMGVAVVGCAVFGPRYGSPGAAVMAAILVASLTAGIAGFAFSAVCGAMLIHLWDDPVQVIQVMMACSIANQAVMVWTMRRRIRWRELGVFLAGGALGLPLGVWVLLHADHRLYRHALGIFLLAYGGYMLAGKLHVARRRRAALDLVAGLLGGITGGAAGFPSASVSIWCGLQGWDQARQRAVFQPFTLLMQVAALVAISALQRQAGHCIGFNPVNLLCIPAALFGTWLGMACFPNISNRQFAVAVNLLLIVCGLSYAM